MKLVRIWHYHACRVCGKLLKWPMVAWKVSEGCNPKYYCEQCKPKEY